MEKIVLQFVQFDAKFLGLKSAFLAFNWGYCTNCTNCDKSIRIGKKPPVWITLLTNFLVFTLYISISYYLYFLNKICNLCNLAIGDTRKAVFSLHDIAQIAVEL